ncbi:MAG: hypothetical protein QM539_10615 [Alphaproteobacteria bacterium]|nr:hypothetical protein [Alphaproteobacteria bacterium]
MKIMHEEPDYQKMKEDAILERYQEKLKNQIQYTPEDRARMQKKIKALVNLMKNNAL